MQVRGAQILLFAAALMLAATLVPRSACAANRYNFLRVHPNQDVGTYLFVQESAALKQLEWNLGTFLLYYNEPFNVTVETVTRRRTGPITTVSRGDGVNHPFFQYLYGALGITDWASIMFDWPLFYVYRFAWTESGVKQSSYKSFTPGDINLAAKFKLLDANDYPVGVALMPAITLPTGREVDFLGDVGVTGEIRAIVESKPLQHLRLALNLAFHTRESVNMGDFTFRDVLKLSLAAAYDVIRSIAVIAEFETQTALNDFFGSQQTSPTEVRLGARWNPNDGPWMFGGGASVGLVYGSGMPLASGFLTASYRGRIKRAPKPEPDLFAELAEQKDCVTISANDGTNTYRYRVKCSSYFGLDKRVPYDHRIILGVIDLVKRSKERVWLEIRGWTDTSGRVAYNRKLSLDRAEYVAVAIRNGLGSKHWKASIRVIGVGEDTISRPAKARRTDTLLR